MAPKPIPKCAHCTTSSSEKWQHIDKVTVLCIPCFEKHEKTQLELENELKEIQAEPSPPPSSSEAPQIKTETAVPSEATSSSLTNAVDVDIKTAAIKQDAPDDAMKDISAIQPSIDDNKEDIATIIAAGTSTSTEDKEEKDSNPESSKEKPVPSLSPRKLRKNVRSSRKGAGASGSGTNGGKTGRSRRYIFKKNPMKAPTITVSTRIVESLFHDSIYYQIGDIVSMRDAKGNTYYAQIRGLQIDSFCEKSAYITWLIPTTSSPPPNERFDAGTYLIGYEEDLPRRLACMDFVMRAPSNYYYDRNNPYPRPDCLGPDNTTQEDNTNFVWANIAHLHQGD